MTLASERTADPVAEGRTFGAGGAEPYAAALRNESNVLYIHRAPSGSRPQPTPMNAGRWNSDADPVDLSLLFGTTGPVLDIGCGPGRMVRAAMDRGMPALGIDVSCTAVQIACEAGLSVLNRSVFDRVPLEGAWRTVLLIDGNIGIGGDPAALLKRSRELLAPDGVLLVEVSSDPDRDLAYHGTLEDAAGRQSDAFPWAEIGITALRKLAADAGLSAVQDWRSEGRWFARLERA